MDVSTTNGDCGHMGRPTTRIPRGSPKNGRARAAVVSMHFYPSSRLPRVPALEATVVPTRKRPLEVDKWAPQLGCLSHPIVDWIPTENRASCFQPPILRDGRIRHPARCNPSRVGHPSAMPRATSSNMATREE